MAMPVSAGKKGVTRQIAVDETFDEFKFETAGKPPYYHMRYKIVLNGDILELCGAGVYTDAQLRSAARGFLKAMYLVVNGKKVVNGFQYFATAPSVKRLKTAQANCKSTGVKHVRGKKLDIEFGSHGRSYSY